MAGSYNHLRNSETGEFQFDLIENLGDAHEACEDCFWLINYLVGGKQDIIHDAIEVHRAIKRGEREMISEELLSENEETFRICPNCHRNTNEGNKITWLFENDPRCPRYAHLRCDHCGFTLRATTKEEVLKMWNRCQYPVSIGLKQEEGTENIQNLTSKCSRLARNVTELREQREEDRKQLKRISTTLQQLLRTQAEKRERK